MQREPVAAPPLREPEATQQQQVNQSFPTDSKEREKQHDAENKEKGIEHVVKRKPNVIEKHYDDCGDDLRGRCAFQRGNACQCGDGYSSSSDEESGIPILQHDQSQPLPTYWFSPVLPPWEQLQVRAGENFLLFNGLPALITHLFSTKANEDTICEIAGGEARTTRVLVRLHDPRITTGPNFVFGGRPEVPKHPRATSVNFDQRQLVSAIPKVNT